MGAGVSTSSNVADAVAAAFTSVINTTNTTFDQDVGQTEVIGFNNCDAFVGGDANISQQATLNASLQMIANVKDSTNIANDIAQVLTQSAQASVGEMAIGYASAANVASTYASMNTNVANNVTQSAKVTTQNEQSFECNNSTITVNGNLNLSQMATSDINDSMSTTVDNTTDVTNTISQTIDQTASATTGMDMWSFLILGIVAVIGIVVFKVMSTRSKNQALSDSNTQNCVMEMARTQNKIQGGDGKFMAAQASCPGCVDRCIEVNQSSHLYIHWGWFLFWLLMLGAMGAVIGAWYGTVASKGCLNSESCGSNSSSTWASGCSCDMDNALYQSSVSCNSPVTETISSLGVPVKYQYPLLHSMTSGTNATNTVSVGAASLQGMMVSSLKLGQTEYNSNNGNNLYTLLTYENMWYNGNTAMKLKSLFQAAAQYILDREGEEDGFTNLLQAINAGGSGATLSTKAHLLFQYMNPLRLEFADNSGTYLEPVQLGASMKTEVEGTNVYPVPSPFRYNLADTTSLGSCSITTMAYKSSGAVFTNVYNPDDASFCNDNSAMIYPSADSQYILTLMDTSGNATKTSFTVTSLLNLLAGNFNDVDQRYVFYDSDSDGPNTYTPLDVYCRWAQLQPVSGTTSNSYDYGMMRLLYAGILSTQTNAGASGSLWGVNSILSVPSYTTNDYAYADGVIYNEFGIPGSGIPPSSIPTSLIVIDADQGVNSGGYEVSQGFAMTAVGSDAPLSGQSFTATSAGMGYCRDWFYNENTLTVMWIIFAFWFLVFPGYIAIRAYIGESQTKATNRSIELGASGSSSEPHGKASNSSGNSKARFLNPNATNPFTACSKNGPGKQYPSLSACRAAFNDK